MGDRTARLWFGATAALALIGTVISVINAASSSTGHFQTAAARALNTFTFFTIDSNILACLSTALLALALTRRGTAFAALRLTGLVCIAVTGIVFHVALSGVFDLASSWQRVANDLVHTVVPVMTVLGWLLLGPRRQFSRRSVWLSLIFPACWLAFTLIRGAIVHWYPYPFVDVTTLGYVRTLVNCVWVALLLLGIAALALALDRRLPQTAAEPSGSAD